MSKAVLISSRFGWTTSAYEFNKTAGLKNTLDQKISNYAAKGYWKDFM